MPEKRSPRARGWATARPHTFVGHVGGPPTCRDPDDDHVIAAALAAKAAGIVTGDKDFLSLGEHQGVKIVTAKVLVDDRMSRA